ncbi:DUF1735 domain-containing protein [Pedobacter frigiditerrae]|uniref:DUF1735 domain-containing protein n=1 Tax=Pedobacter frigiditerrae TaxID=2530452 RepID=UPI00292DD605|nr:DUF1735 domain-containing protein [Pedobacter frigiditerrae]
MKKYFYKSAGLLLAIAMLTSCLKDDRLVLDPDKGVNVVDFINPGEIAVHGSTTPLYVLSYPILPTATTIPITVSYSGPADEAPQDITVNLGVGTQAVIDQYNTEQNKTFLMMPSSWYTVSATSVVIPKGAKTATFNVVVNTSQIILTASYVLPLKITGANGAAVSTNFSNILLNIGAKNAYDGLYRYTTSANTSLVPNADKANVPLVTAGPNSVQIKPGLLATYGNVVTYTIDPATNQVTVTAALGSGAVTPPDTRSKWDPATKTLTVYWAQIASPRIFEEKFVYTGVR